MKKFLKIAMLGIAGIGMGNVTMAQCPTSVKLKVKSKTVANCPSSGSVSLGSNCVPGTLVFTVLSGPTGAPVNLPQSDSAFNALTAGNYVVQAACSANPAILDTVHFTIANGYTAVSNVNTTVTPSCGASNGAIAINGVTGGSLPLQYSVIQNSDANYPDNLSNYTSTPGTYSSLAPGIYQMRIKDACNQIYTQTIEVPAALPAVLTNLIINQPTTCGATQNALQVWQGVDPVTGNTVDLTSYLNNGGLTIKIYDGGGSCTKGSLITTFNYTKTSGPYFSAAYAASGQYYVEVTTACGVTASQCMNATLPLPQMNFQVSSAGCGTILSPATMKIRDIYDYAVIYPIIVTVTDNNTGIPIAGSPFTFASQASMNNAFATLPPNDYHLVVKNACGTIIKDIVINNIQNAGAPKAGLASTDFDCVDQVGAKDVTISFSGYIPGISNADSIKIISGPSNVGVNGYIWQGSASWVNLFSGNYVFRIYTSCGTTDVSYTFNGGTGLIRKIAVVATNFCGGTGKIAIDPANTSYNGNGNVSYILFNVTTNKAVDSNSNGSWTNLQAGTYLVKMKIQDYCSDDPAGNFYTVASNTVTINASSTPQITKKLGMICEDASGNLLTKGSAYLELAGAPPLVLEYADITGNPSSPVYTTFSSNAASTVTIPNLLPYHIYDIRVTACGISGGTQVTIGKLDPLKVSNTVNPCVGSPYILAVPEMSGASYVWKNAAGVIVSNTYSYAIPNYTASYDGIYTCTVTFAGCVTRVVTTTLNSTMCSMPLPIKLTSFIASNNGCKAVLTWNAIYHNTDKEFIVERSSDGKNFTAIATFPAQQANGQYHYTDATVDLNKGNAYYRLKMVDVDGTFVYAPTQVVKACSNGQYNESSFVIIPNPAVAGQNVNMVYNGSQVNGHYTIVNSAGQTVQRSNNMTVGGSAGNTINISLQGLNAGVYIVAFTTEDNRTIGHEKLVVY